MGWATKIMVTIQVHVDVQGILRRHHSRGGTNQSKQSQVQGVFLSEGCIGSI
jgi:hypothetical protein